MIMNAKVPLLLLLNNNLSIVKTNYKDELN